jgi:uncharacterized delta-60 repeat protein
MIQQFMTKTILLIFALNIFSCQFGFSQAGILDLSFGVNGIVKTDIANANDYGFSTIIQPDGKIIVAGFAMIDTIQYNNFVVIRYQKNGNLDSTFGNNGIVNTDIFGGSDDNAQSVCLQPDGKIIVAGKSLSTSNDFDFAVVRYNTNGSLDLSFDIDGKVTTDIAGENDYGSCVKLQTDGKIVLAGYSGTATNNKIAVVRYNANGSLDTSFDMDGIVTTQVGYIYLNGQSLAIQNDGKIIASASTSTVSMLNNLDFLVVRYHVDGSLDTSFDNDGIVVADGCYQDHVYAVAVQNDGKIILGGSGYDTVNIAMGLNFLLMRLNTNGSLDSSFDFDGKVFTEVTSQADIIYGLAIQGNGKIVAIGHGSDGVGDFRIALARYLSDGRLDTSFSNDGITTTNMASAHEYGESVAIQNDGKIVVTGFLNNGATFNIFASRYIGDMPTSLQDIDEHTIISYFPNPFSNTLKIKLDKDVHHANILLFNTHGQKVKEINDIHGNMITLQRDDLASGFYFLHLYEGDKIVARQKVQVIEK